MARWTRLGTALTTVMVLAAAGCNGKTSTPAPTTNVTSARSDEGATETGTQETQLTRGGVPPAQEDLLLVAYGDDPDTLNAVTSSDTTSQAFQMRVYEYLARRKFDNPDQWDPQLAESWDYDPETMTYTLHLRKNVMWHPMKLPDGTPLPATEFTSRDVKFTFDCILNPNVEAAHIRSYYENPDAVDESERYKIEVEAVDKYTVTIRWKTPYFLAEDYTLWGGGGNFIIPYHVYSVDEHGDPIAFDISSKEFADGFNNHWANTKMCGTGPMMFEEWTREQRFSTVRNPDYWGAPHYFSRIESLYVSNPNTIAEMVLNRDLDFGPFVQKDKYLQSKTEASVVSGNVKLVEFDYPAYRYIGYNLRRPFLSDKRVRQALAHAAPVETMVEEVFKGLAVPLHGPFLPDSPASDPSVKPFEYDLEKAKALLDEAGWVDSDEDGIRDKVVEGVHVKAEYDLMIYSEAPPYQAIAQMIQEDCRKLGVVVKISPNAWALMLQKLRKKDFDAAMLGWALDWKMDPYQLFHGSQAEVQESSNAGGYQSEEVDALIEELRVTMDADKQIALFHEIHRQIYEDQPYTFLFVDKQTAGYNARIENVNFYQIRPCYDNREWISKTPRLVGR